MDDEKLSIKVKIDGHVYPLKVKRSEEELVRRAGKLMEERLMAMKKNYAANDKVSDFDFLAMATIGLVAKYLDRESKTDDSELLSEMRIMSSEINEYIQKIQAL
jgi:cell division protein ZapA